ncbi:hypothetical protein F2P81_016861 [Scophthalmus maximus]|uniref:Uncharacterized protein n=1 Tax=Scophthalmus maximus TaxID=52904 RepID=A0A6A4SE76_SCOMX|nr:hypothetical protein F2P81_016861 [Scophthalmus maximus]
MPFDCGSEEPHLGHVNGGYLFLRAGSLRVTRSSVVMLSTVDGALELLTLLSPLIYMSSSTTETFAEEDSGAPRTRVRDPVRHVAWRLFRMVRVLELQQCSFMLQRQHQRVYIFRRGQRKARTAADNRAGPPGPPEAHLGRQRPVFLRACIRLYCITPLKTEDEMGRLHDFGSTLQIQLLPIP